MCVRAFLRVPFSPWSKWETKGPAAFCWEYASLFWHLRDGWCAALCLASREAFVPAESEAKRKHQDALGLCTPCNMWLGVLEDQRGWSCTIRDFNVTNLLPCNLQRIPFGSTGWLNVGVTVSQGLAVLFPVLVPHFARPGQDEPGPSLVDEAAAGFRIRSRVMRIMELVSAEARPTVGPLRRVLEDEFLLRKPLSASEIVGKLMAIASP